MVKLAKEQGYVTYDDINEALPENMADPEEMEQLINRLRSMEIDIIDASEVDRYKDGKKDIDDEEEEKDQEARHPRRPGPDVSEADGAGAAADARAGSRDFQAHRGRRTDGAEVH